MKTIFLKTNYQWQSFTYENISELSDELNERGITIGNGAFIGDGAYIGNGAFIGDRAFIGNGAFIGNRASIGYEASIGNEGSILKSIVIKGSNHIVNYYFTDVIHIGCQKRTIEEWEREYEEIGNEHTYSEEEIAEYKRYIDICKNLYEVEKSNK